MIVKSNGNCAPNEKPMIKDATYTEPGKGKAMKRRPMHESKRTNVIIRGQGNLNLTSRLSETNPAKILPKKFHMLRSDTKDLMVVVGYPNDSPI